MYDFVVKVIPILTDVESSIEIAIDDAYFISEYAFTIEVEAMSSVGGFSIYCSN